MSRGNRNLRVKTEKARGERKAYAVGMQMLDDARPAHLAKAVPIIAAHFGTTPAPITQAERDRLVADFVARGRVKKCRAAEYDARQSSVNKRHIGATLTAPTKSGMTTARAIRAAFDAR